MPLRAFVTGGTGFIGANLVAYLNTQNTVVRVLRRKSSTVEALAGLDYEICIGDILDNPGSLTEKMAGCDWVFHTAAVSDYWRQNKKQLYRANVDGTRNVLAAAKLAKVKRFVFTSSLAAMGVPINGQLLNESSEFNLLPNQFPYGHSKHLAEKEVRRATAAGLPGIIVNPSVVLGPRDVNLISGSIIVEAAKGRLRVYPPGGVNYVAVEDVAAGHYEAALNGRTGERYILAGENLTHHEATKIICQVIGRKPPSVGLPSWALSIFAVGVSGARSFLGNRIPLDANQVRISGKEIYVDDSKTREELNLLKTPFVDAVQRTFDWYNMRGYLG
jgi:dihydroflavonol-4-reductase